MIVPPFRPVRLDSVDSTNSEARRRAEAGAPDGAAILARRQTAGRGRRGRRWLSPEGNLYMTLLLRPDMAAGEAAALSFVAAVALADALAELAPGVEIACKWPNDALANGRKCAGLLLESAAGGGRIDWIAVGVGINLSSHPDDLPYPATDLAAEGASATPEQAAEAFHRRFFRWRRVRERRGFAPVRRAWLARGTPVGAPLVARTGRETFTGAFAGLAEDGALLLREQGGGVRRIAAGDVFPTDS